MSILPPSLSALLQEKLNVTIVNETPVGGGEINQAALIKTRENQALFVKWNASAPAGFFRAERRGLEELAKSGVVKVPGVLLVHNGEPVQCLVLESLLSGERNRAREEELGRSLAQLHKVTAPAFGLPENNFIGLTPQENTPCAKWSEFFVEHRLRPQLALGNTKGWTAGAVENLFSKKEARIRSLLDSRPNLPALVHGDFWSGNVFWSKTGPVLIDPAVYYGTFEVDLAFTELFGGFGSHFYSAYYEVTPKLPGYEERKEVLNLYHLMNHANLFGGSYVRTVQQVLNGL